MVTCCQSDGIKRQFGHDTAEKELRRFRRKGPIRTTRLLIDDLRAAGIAGASLLDIGGGVGALHHILLDQGLSEATHVDLSDDYLEMAGSEATRRGHAARVRFIAGDFVQIAPLLADADVVTLDRVICCFPDMESLVDRAADKSRRFLGAVYPRVVWWMRLGLATINRLKRLQGSGFRVYLHSPAAIDARLRERGFILASAQRTIAWDIVVYRRIGAS